MSFRYATTLLFCLISLLLTVAAHGEEDEALELFGGEAEQVLTTARIPRPVSRIAENVTVITAEQIALLNAHTLAEVLNTVPGIQLNQVRTPGSFTFFLIQGAQNTLVQVLIDGVPQSDLGENQADIGLIPVQQIERVEIIKGAASAAWGSALGGVVNVITKSPDQDKPVTGAVSASYGEHFTTDLRGELSGTVDRFGYYLSGGNLHSDGLLPNNRINHNNAYGKLVYNLPTKGTITLGGDFRDAFRGLNEFLPLDIRDTYESKFIYSFLTFNYPFSDRLILELTSRYSSKDVVTEQGFMTSSDLFKDFKVKESTWGTGAKLTWGDSLNNLAAGVEYEHDKTHTSEPVQQLPLNNFERTFDHWGAYANGAVSFGRLTILPGLRIDHTGISGDYLSSMLGATWLLTEKTVLRAYGASGYSQPKAVFEAHALQKVWTAQAGAETSDLPGLWLKGTLFYNLMHDVEALNGSGNLTDQIRQGFEIEARTLPLYGFSLAAGYTLTDVWEKSTHGVVEGIPEELAKIGLHYSDEDFGLRGVLTGNYVKWDTTADSTSRGSTIIWDLSLTKKISAREFSPELFFSAHNLFNGAQYGSELYKNAPRWIEGGVRFRF